jgi:hypothetical protein
MNEVADIERDLESVLPYLTAAEKALDSIKTNDIYELSNMRVPTDTTKLVMDAVQILLYQKPLLTKKKDKT